MSVAPNFRSAHASGGSWSDLARACVEALLPLQDGANLGIIYATDALAGDLSSILTFLRERTRIADWIGSVGLGICAGGDEIFEEPGLAVMIAALPQDAFRILPPLTSETQTLGSAIDAWVGARQPTLGIVHGDPRSDPAPQIAALTAKTGAFLVGALAAARRAPVQISGRIVENGLSGVLLAPEIAVATGLSQGCSPIGPTRLITEARDNLVMAIDDRPALEVFKEDIGELMSRDLRRVAGRIFAAFPVRGSDTADYLVRNLVALDIEHQWLAVAQAVAAGDSILFCRRDTPSAITDLRRMLTGLKQRSGGVSPRGGLYFSCVARGPHLFGAAGTETALIREILGDFPLIGFFGNGEISHDRLYSYTGVLLLFL